MKLRQALTFCSNCSGWRHRGRPAVQVDIREIQRRGGQIAVAHPVFNATQASTGDEDKTNLAIWLKKKGFRADQFQTFYPSPTATAMLPPRTQR